SYEEELLRIEREMLSKKQLLYQKGSNEYVKYEEEIEKVTLDAKQKAEKIELDRQAKIKALIAKYNKEAAKTEAQKKAEELKTLNDLFTEELRTTEQYYILKQAIEDKYDPEKKKNKEAAEQLVKDNPNQTHKKKDLKSLLDDDKLSSGAKDTLINDSEAAELKQLDALQSLHNAEIDEILNYEELRTAIAQKYNDLRETNDKESFARKMQLTQFALEQI
ncbi:hypothetical protein, partial [Candidatus Symbiothrix dinenymphae]|uniref:hypothetical protein n=1 Tax=Candidatus Symbiothrix dinenymphae TaxID=467085 RepID=UPI000A53D2BD